ncbi:MAG: fused MFS/spermidine synthase, partial [Acidobacteriota bacterium]
TLLMGGTLPVAVHAVEQRADIGRRRVAWLYGINTLGAVGGALLANFVLIEQLGVSRTLWLAAACNLLLAVVASRIARSAVEQTADEPPTDLDVPETTPRPAPAGSVDLPRRTLLVVAALVGFVFFVMELVWYRMLAPILGGSTYTMGLILAIALAGIGIGGWFYALGRRDRRPTVATLATTCGLEALVLAIPFALGDTLALATVFVRDLSALGFLGLVASWALIAMIVVFPAALLAGYQFPLLVGLLGAGDQGAGDDVGTAYAWNTAGAIVGSLAGGFGLLPLLGAPTLWRGAVGVLVVTSLWLAWTARTGQRSMRRELPTVPWIAAVLATLVTVGSVGPTAFWRHVPIGAGRAEVGDLATPNAWTAYRREVAWATRYEADGRESSIALQVVDDPALMVNGKSDGSGRGDATTTVLSGVIGASLHPDPERALVIGLGLGATAGFFTTVDSIERVDVVELEPAVVDVARQVGPLGYDVLDDPKTVLHLGDGRELVVEELTEQSFEGVEVVLFSAGGSI